MKAHRSISIFLSLCFSVFLGHNLIPHHHHSEQVSVPVSSECPVEHEDAHGHSPKADHKPLHCHAFNDVVFDKYQSIQIGRLSPHLLSLAIFSSNRMEAPLFMETSSAYAPWKIPDKPAEYYGVHSLRAPPGLG